MFVKIMKSKVERLVQCEDYSLEHFDDYVFLEMFPNKGAETINKGEGNQIFIMNNSGLTIDRHRI